MAKFVLVGRPPPRSCRQCAWQGTTPGQRRAQRFGLGYVMLAVSAASLDALGVFDLQALLTPALAAGLLGVLVGVPLLLMAGERCPRCGITLGVWH